MTRQVLSDRSVIAAAGDDATAFLQSLVTADLAARPDRVCRPAALLTPQGKILFDMLLVRDAAGWLIDCRADMAEALERRLSFYRLRARVGLARRDDLAVVWSPPGAAADGPPDTMQSDGRTAALGQRGYAAPASGTAAGGDAAPAYHALRVAAGVAEAGLDYAPDSVFPHEAGLDLLSGVSFAKGCFIGQEVVSRMHHRATVRKRFLPCALDGEAPAPGTPVLAGERRIGTAGSSAGGMALALLRLDHLEAAAAAGTPLTAAGTEIRPRLPDWLSARAAGGGLARVLA